jgi:hypothetical protein
MKCPAFPCYGMCFSGRRRSRATSMPHKKLNHNDFYRRLVLEPLDQLSKTSRLMGRQLPPKLSCLSHINNPFANFLASRFPAARPCTETARKITFRCSPISPSRLRNLLNLPIKTYFSVITRPARTPLGASCTPYTRNFCTENSATRAGTARPRKVIARQPSVAPRNAQRSPAASFP